jgi:hypothetical protein
MFLLSRFNLRASLWLRAWAFVVLFLLLVPAFARAAGAAVAPTQVLSQSQLWTAVIGALVPLVTYVLNHYAPWANETVKGIVLLVVAAVAGGLYTALGTSVFGFNDQTLQLVATSVFAAFAAHGLIWKPTGVAASLGAGTNATHATTPSTPPATPAA